MSEGNVVELGPSELEEFRFDSSVTGLEKSKRYYFRAFAENAQGVFTSDTISVKTPPFAVSKEDPTVFLIESKEDLHTLTQLPSFWDQKYLQTADIELTSADFEEGGVFYNEGTGYEPIGNNTTNFTGSYDGGGHVIDSLQILRDANTSTVATNYIGLFGFAKNATIKNLGVTNAQVSGYSDVGIIAGEIEYTSKKDSAMISRVYATGTLTARQRSGGLFGKTEMSSPNDKPHIYEVFSDVQATGSGTGNNIASLIGENDLNIKYAYGLGSVTNGGNGTRGMISNNYDGFLDRVVSFVHVDGGNDDPTGVAYLTSSDVTIRNSLYNTDLAARMGSLPIRSKRRVHTSLAAGILTTAGKSMA
jgi:hypothetical protein